ncbi:hypothetical protein DAEQUDRAFT_815657 [Daedalea quercina L-15889]|uniref:F-box domain-containing protein n=1 Tax=Daedalea quercina L-15889 TaxID=1314783 RepID=A0A165KPZ3_9APHY|nr:hypothetical protein DAEQUDRAFT_815657 [Daedalea quercina L-15889]
MVPTNASDQLLRIPHLLEQVLEHFAPLWSESDQLRTTHADYRRARARRRTLAELACVCKAFAEIALGIIWRHLDGIDDLLRVLPSFQPCGDCSVVERITPQQWARFQEYARRVRGLSWTLSRGVSIHQMVWTILERQLKGQYLLPRLHSLVIYELDVDEPAGLMLLLSPSLRILRLSFVETEIPLPVRTSTSTPSLTRPTPAGILIQLMLSALPQLSQFWIETGLPKDFPPSYLSSLAHLERLEKLDLLYSGAVVDYAVLRYISNLTSLRTVQMKVSLNGIDHSEPLRLGGPFQELEDIHLAGSISDLRRVFEATQYPKLTNLALSILTAPTVTVLKDALVAICSRVSNSIYEAHLYISGQIPSPSLPVSDILEPYLAFASMSSMNMELDHYIPRMDDADARAFASAWPALTHFHLLYGPSLPIQLRQHTQTPGAPGVTVAGLAEFARGCPKLDVLTLPLLDVRGLPSPPVVPPVGQAAMHHLQIHEYLGGETANLLDLAVIIDRLFPHVGGMRRSVRMCEDVSRNVLHADGRCRPRNVTDMLLAAIWASRSYYNGASPECGHCMLEVEEEEETAEQNSDSSDEEF